MTSSWEIELLEPHCTSFNIHVYQCMAVVVNKTKQGNSVLFLLLKVHTFFLKISFMWMGGIYNFLKQYKKLFDTFINNIWTKIHLFAFFLANCKNKLSSCINYQQNRCPCLPLHF